MIDPETTYSGVMKFMLRSPTIEGCAAQKYVQLVSKEKAPAVYALKTDQKKIKEV